MDEPPTDAAAIGLRDRQTNERAREQPRLIIRFLHAASFGIICLHSHGRKERDNGKKGGGGERPRRDGRVNGKCGATAAD